MISFQPIKAPHLSPLCKTVFIAFSLMCLVVSCNQQSVNENKALLENAARITETEPQKALKTLQNIEIGLLNEDDYAYYTLLQVRVWNVSGTNVAASEKEVLKARDYFIAKNNAEKAAFACFVTAKVYEAQNNIAKATYNYLLAEEWVNNISNTFDNNFRYSAIFYNMAHTYNTLGNYNEALIYINKALEYIDKEKGIYTDKLYALEIKALIYIELNLPDDALRYLDEAEKLAVANNNKAAKTRIFINRYHIYLKYDDNKVNIKKYNEWFSSISVDDTIAKGAAFIAKAHIDFKSKNYTEAHKSIYKAKDFLEKVPNDMKDVLFHSLYLIEKKLGNTTKAEEYNKLYHYYKEKYDSNRRLDEISLQNELKKQQDEKINQVLALSTNYHNSVQKQKNNNYLLLFFAGACIISIGLLFYKLKIVKRNVKQIDKLRSYGKKELIRSILQRRDLIELLEELDEHVENETPLKPSELNVLVNKIDDMIPRAHWHEMPPFLEINYGKMFKNLRNQLTMLNEEEFRVCALICTKMFNEQEMISILKITQGDYQRSKKSMEYKLYAAGINLGTLRKEARKHYISMPAERLN